MEVSLTLLNEFRNIFTGSTNAYGIHNYKETKKGDKEEGTNFTKIELLIEQRYKEHLQGKVGLGVIPIKSNSTCNFGVLDIDIYRQELKHYINVIYSHDFPIFPFRSKSGGLHLYVFFKEEIKVKKAKEYLNTLRVLLGLSNKTEIFPKQEVYTEGTIGNWINLPYYDYAKTKQFLIKPDYTATPLEEAVTIIRKKMQTNVTLDNFFEGIPLTDAPPCLQSIYLTSNTDFRNDYLFSMSVYYKSKVGDDFEYKIAEANNLLDRPLTLEELQKTVIATHKKKDYSYKCSLDPLVEYCDKNICRMRKYGIGGDEVSQLSYEEFIQYTTDPPYYEWKVNGVNLQFYDEQEIINQMKFRMLCFRLLHILPFKIKDINWTKIINNALKNIIIKQISPEDDISPGGMFKDYLVEYLESKSLAKTREQIMVDRVYKDNEKICYVFKAKNLLSFLIHQKRFYSFGITMIQHKLKEMGGKSIRYYISPRFKSIRAWILPFSSLSDFIEQRPKKLDIDFKENIKDEF